MSDSVDAELLDIINKISKIQNVVGGARIKEKSHVGEDGKIDRFLDLRGQMLQKLEIVKETLETIHQLEKSPGANPKELITAQSRVRTDLSALNEELKELDNLVRTEMKKRRTKLSPEELQVRQNMVQSLQLEIQGLRDIQRSGYIKGYQAIAMPTMDNSGMFRNKDDIEAVKGDSHVNSGVVSGNRNVEMTDQHRSQLQKIKERDVAIDMQVEELGRGIDDLREIALAAQEEITVQNKVLDHLGERVGDVQEHVININTKLKQTLEEARKGDKICMDICCLLLLVGMIVVLVEVLKGKK